MVKQAASLSIDMMALQAISAVDSRIAGKVPADSMHLFSNTTATWTSATFVPNRNLWCEDLRRFLTGVHMRAGAWNQSYGLQAITPRHLISCGHNGPGIGESVRFVNVDGTVFDTTILQWQKDNGTSAFVADLSVYLTAHELPAWVHKATILRADASARARLVAAGVPTVAVSQGNVVGTPRNRMVYAKQLDLAALPPHRSAFGYSPVVGDSGTPEFLMTPEGLLLLRIITLSNGAGVFVSDYLDYVQALIVRADTAAGISTGYAPAVQNSIILPAPGEAFSASAPAGAWNGALTLSGINAPAINGQLVPGAANVSTYPGGRYWSTDGASLPASAGPWAEMYQLHMISPAAATLEQIAPIANYQPGGSSGVASNIYVRTTGLGAITTYWLIDNNGAPYWTRFGGGGANENATSIPAGRYIFPNRRVPGESNGFSGGLGQAWQASPSTQYMWVLSPFQDGAAGSLGIWYGDGALPSSVATWLKFGTPNGDPILTLSGGTQAPPVITTL